MAVAVAAVPQGAASKWVPTPFYVAAYAAKTLAALLPHRVNEPLMSNFPYCLHSTSEIVNFFVDLVN